MVTTNGDVVLDVPVLLTCLEKLDVLLPEIPDDLVFVSACKLRL